MGSQDEVEDTDEADDSDEEYLALNEKQNLKNYDDKFVPLYAKYVTAYGYDE